MVVDRHRISHAGTAVLPALLLVGVAFAGCSVPQFDPIPRGGTSSADVPNVPFGADVLDSGHRLFGVRMAEWPSERNDEISGFESLTGSRADLVDITLNWNTPWQNASGAVEHTIERGSLPILTWDPTGLTTQDIVEGSKEIKMRDAIGSTMTVDSYINEFAIGVCNSAKTTQGTVLMRPMRDANGDWNSWAIGKEPNTPDSFQAAWTKIRDTFGKYCQPGSDVLFILSVNHASAGGNASFAAAYPGDDQVEYVGLAGYNWGDHQNWGWQTFSNLFRPSYCTIAPLTSKPMLVTEWASVEEGGSKAHWIRGAFEDFAEGQYPKLHGFVWVNSNSPADSEWPVDSSRDSLDAYREGVSTIQEQRTGGSAQTSLEAGAPCT